MPITIEKEWAAVNDQEEIELTASSKEAVIDALQDLGKDASDYEIVAVPKSHSSMFV